MAILKATYEKEDDIPAGYGELFEHKGDAWALKRDAIEGVQTDANVKRLEGALAKERKARSEAEGRAKKYADKLGDRDLDEVLTALDEVDDLKAQLGAGGGKAANEEQIKARIDAAVKAAEQKQARKVDELTRNLAEAQGRATELDGKIRQSTIDSELTKAATTSKIRAEALSDVLARRGLFELSDDGKVVTRDNLGVTPGVGPDVWLAEHARSQSPHWWAESVGGGAGDRDGKGAVNGANPFDKKAPNVQRIGEIAAKDPAKALQYAKAAGYPTIEAGLKAIARGNAGANGARP